jgi:hypothetical protein
VAYSNQKSTIEVVTKGRYEEDSRQVHAIRWNPDGKLYQGCVRKSSYDSEKTIDLDDAWVDKNFSARYKLDFKKLAVNDKSEFVFVPPGDFRDKATLPKSLVVPGAPAVVFQQGTIDLCALASMASVLSFIGRKSHAKLLYSTFQDDINAQGADTRIVNSVRDHIMNSLDKKLWEIRKLDNDTNMLMPSCREEWKWESARPNSCFMMWVLRGTDKSNSHCVGVVGQWIFDSNLEHALPLTKAALDWCCGARIEQEESESGYLCVQRGYLFRRWPTADNRKRRRQVR